MAHVGHRVCVLVTAASFLWAGVTIEVAHNDIVAGGSRVILTTHACGSHEIHIPVDQFHQCLACALSGQRVSTPPTVLLPDVAIEMTLSASPSQAGHPITISYLFSGKRGPPLS